MTNQSFCYWLQGYFEIAREPCLTTSKLLVIKEQLEKIQGPLGLFTQWLSETIAFLTQQNHTQAMRDMFLPKIQQRLNLVFFHVIDQSYERNVSIAEAKKIHDGLLND